jgi:hypothetical protein
MKTLALAHMCDVEISKTRNEKTGEDEENLFYNSPSPDEVALVEYASLMGF